MQKEIDFNARFYVMDHRKEMDVKSIVEEKNFEIENVCDADEQYTTVLQ